jgi:hypothetical protein
LPETPRNTSKETLSDDIVEYVNVKKDADGFKACFDALVLLSNQISARTID